MDKYHDRLNAGKFLAKELSRYKNHPDGIIFALPRGGVPVAYEIATELSLPLDVFLVRKLGVPGHRELAMGAIASGEIAFFNQSIISDLNISQEAIDEVIKAESSELKRREEAYRGDKPFPDLTNKTVILVDDGIATGATVRAAIEALRVHKPSRIVLAVPVAPRSTLYELDAEVDEIVCPLAPVNFYAVGIWYEQFPQTSDDEVRDFLSKARATV
ncbi:phosphoribosyltransferase [Legionella impletisoli]|uniref:Phosphoribosyltransferase n=1 Tax=Legionella impletisoli TaxID=343510 RepID=A0A917K220_9GAMM|nr:phosphoribosyltransferase [Legionella impletisoli]GGI93541.1 phosphoribosyltransferase [Legionella impletisoli]